MTRMAWTQRLDELAREYLEAWNKADNEKKYDGKVSRATNLLLCRIERELKALEA